MMQTLGLQEICAVSPFGERQQEELNMKTKTVVGLGLFTAIVVVLQLLAVGLRALGLFSISLVLVPIVVGAAVYGKKGGAWLGFALQYPHQYQALKCCMIQAR